VSRRLGVGPATVEALQWLARVGPTPAAAWACAMSWGERTARSHAERLAREGWAARAVLPRGQGTLLYATRTGVSVAAVKASPAPEPAPTWWAHLAGCGWVAAWLTVRGREMLAPRELLCTDQWRGELTLPGSHVSHRPDLVATVPGKTPVAIEVELQRKAKHRLRAILGLHAKWIAAGQSAGCVYVCADEAIRELVASEAVEVGLREADRTLRVELLAEIRAQALAQGSRGS
jgi:hypothetical protein